MATLHITIEEFRKDPDRVLESLERGEQVEVEKGYRTIVIAQQRPGRLLSDVLAHAKAKGEMRMGTEFADDLEEVVKERDNAAWNPPSWD